MAITVTRRSGFGTNFVREYPILREPILRIIVEDLIHLKMASFGGSYAIGTEKGSSSSRNNLPEHNPGEHGHGYFTNLLLHKSPPRASPCPRRDGPPTYQRVFNVDPRLGPNHTIDLRNPQERCVLNQQCLTLSFPGPPTHPIRLMVDTNSADGSLDINVVMTDESPSVRSVSTTTTPNNVQASRRGPIDINAPLSRTVFFEMGGRSIDATAVQLAPASQTPTPGTMLASFQSMQHNPLAAGTSNDQEINHAPCCIVGPRTLHPGVSLRLRRNEATNQWNEELIGHQANDFDDECYCMFCWNGPLPPHVAEFGNPNDEPQEEANNFNMGANAEETEDDMDSEEAEDDMNVDDGSESDEDYIFVDTIQSLIARNPEIRDHMNLNGEDPFEMEEEDEMPDFGGLSIELIPHVLRRKQFSPFIAALTSRTDRSCTICFEEFRAGQDNGMLKCKHEFHYDCIETWLKKKNSCPLCRAVAFGYGDYFTLPNV